MKTGDTHMTRQRRAILDELCRVVTHPTADEVYNMVRLKMPRISLGTVYRNLEMLSSNGTILKLHISGTQNRFDGNVEPHYHIRCACCGRVDDIFVPLVDNLNEVAQCASGYQDVDHSTEFAGICPKCVSK